MVKSFIEKSKYKIYNSNMTFGFRRLVFYTLLLLFVLTATAIVFYSQGWRLFFTDDCSFERWRDCSVKFQKIGAIYIETNSKDVIIKVDGKIFPDQSGIIQKGTLINNLPPKNYKVEIQKSGYQPWRKNLRVQSSLVAEALRIILISENPEKNLIPLTKPINNFWLNNQQKFIVSSNGALYYAQSGSLKKIRGDDFVNWNAGGDSFIVKDKKKQTYYLYKINQLDSTININAVLNNLGENSDINQAVFHPLETDKLIIETNNKLAVMDLENTSLTIMIKNPPPVWTVKNPNIYYIKTTQNLKLKTKNYQLAAYNLAFKEENALAELPKDIITSTNIKEISIANFGGEIAILTKNGELYLFNQQKQELKQIASSAKEFVFAPDSKKIAFLDKDGKINVYFLEDYKIGMNKKEGEVISINLENKQNIDNLIWHEDSHHLFAQYLYDRTNYRIAFTEIDERLPINTYNLIDKASQFYYDFKLNRIYFVAENKLYLLNLE